MGINFNTPTLSWKTDTTKTRTELKCKINPRGSSTVYNEIHTVKENEKTGEKELWQKRKINRRLSTTFKN